MAALFARKLRPNQGQCSFFLRVRNVNIIEINKDHFRLGQLGLVSTSSLHAFSSTLLLETNIYSNKACKSTCSASSTSTSSHGNWKSKRLTSTSSFDSKKNNKYNDTGFFSMLWRSYWKTAVLAGSGVAVIGFSWIIGNNSKYQEEGYWKYLVSNYGLGNIKSNSKVMCSAFDNEVSTVEADSGKAEDLIVTLYQYETCPFCCKVRAFLDFYGIPYKKVEVGPLFRKEIKFSEYRKVPIAMIGNIQVNDSSLIISVLRSHMLGKGSIEELLTYYPKMEDTKTKKVEFLNRNSIMYKGPMQTKEEQDAVREERKWRQWVDDTFIHTLSPNIYRTLGESYHAFKYFSSVGNFGAFERISAQYVGTVAMYLLSKFVLKKRYNLKDDVRQSMYEGANRWTKAVGKKRKFMGGEMPNLADLAMYGVLSGIEGLDAFEDLMKNTKIKPWYDRVRKAAKAHQGASEYDKFVLELEHQ